MPTKKPANPTPEDSAPHSVPAENAVIASCLINPEAFAEVRAVVSPQDFHTDAARESFTAMEQLYPGIDHLTVSEATRGRVPHDYLSGIASAIPTSVHAVYYAKIVAQKSYQRRMIEAAGRIAQRAYENHTDSAELFMACQGMLHDLEPQSTEDIIDAKGQAERMLRMVSQRRDQKVSGGLAFGYRDLDQMTGGMYPGNLVIVGARPGVGKSQILAEIDLQLRRYKRRVMVGSAEMTIDEWNEREIAMATGVSVKAQRSGNGPSDESMAELTQKISEMKHYWLSPPVTISRIVNKARVLHKTRGIDLLIVDYLQQIADSVPREYGSNIRERVGYISRSLKHLAQELNIPVLAAAQLNREIENRPDKRPRMADLKEAGDIEQDADIIILLHRPAMYDPNKEPNTTYLYVPKIRQIGEIGHVRLVWHTEKNRHFDMAWEE